MLINLRSKATATTNKAGYNQKEITGKPYYPKQ
jgi:hypothetical protein